MSYIKSTDTYEEIVGELGVTEPIFRLSNLTANQDFFVTTATPEGAIVGSIGDIATNTTTGVIYSKTSGTATNTGWSALSSGSAYTTLQTSNVFSLSANVTRYAALGGNSLVSNENLVGMPMPVVTLYRIKLNVISNTLNGDCIISTRVQNSNQGPTITIPAATTGVVTSTGTYTLTLDDLVNISFDTTAAATGTIVLGPIGTSYTAL